MDRDLFYKKINVKQVAVKDIFNKTIWLSTILKSAANVNKTVWFATPFKFVKNAYHLTCTIVLASMNVQLFISQVQILSAKNVNYHVNNVIMR